MNTVTLLLPPRPRLAADAALASGAVARWLAKGDARAAAAAGREIAIRELFQFTGTSVPVAALTREGDCRDAAGSTWLRADPAHVRADMATARMLACGELGLSLEDCQALLQPLKPLFGDSGFPIDAPTPSRWYLRAPYGAKLPLFAPPERALGDDLRLHLPEGAEAKRWRSLLNEAQVVLHNHPLNQQRIARGQLPVNSLWFWGAGTLPEWVRSEVQRVRTRDATLAALATRAKSAVLPPADGPLPGWNGHSLLDFDDADGLAELGPWLAAIDAALGKGQISRVQLLLASGERGAYEHRNRWRFWRRVQPLSA